MKGQGIKISGIWKPQFPNPAKDKPARAVRFNFFYPCLAIPKILPDLQCEFPLYIEKTINSAYHLPVVDSTRLRGEVYADFVESARVCHVGTGVALVLDLLQGGGSRAVQLELEDVDVVVGLDDAVYPSLALLLLRVHDVKAHQPQDKVERVMKVTLPFPLIVFAPHAVRNACQEGSEQFLERFQDARF